MWLAVALAALGVSAIWAFAAGSFSAGVGVGCAAAATAVAAWGLRSRRDATRHGAAMARFAAELGAGAVPNERLPETAQAPWAPLARALNQLSASLAARYREQEVTRAHFAALGAMAEEGWLIAVGGDERIAAANARLADLLAAPPDLAGRPLLEVVRERDLVEPIRGAFTGRCGGGEAELSDGSGRRVAVRVAPFAPPGGGRGAAAVFRDVSALRNAEAARRDWLANASHELKTPLAALRGYAELLEDRVPDERGAGRAVAAIVANARRLSQLVDDLLELFRAQSGKLALEPTACDAAEIARALLGEFAPRLLAGGLTARLVVEGETALCQDPRATAQVIGNLLDNALKYTSPGGQIDVFVGPAARDDVLRIAVRDTGVGLAAEHHSRVFERFYRVGATRPRPEPPRGAGLGLAIVKHLVRAMGGGVGVESEVGRGALFWVELPRRGD